MVSRFVCTIRCSSSTCAYIPRKQQKLQLTTIYIISFIFLVVSQKTKLFFSESQPQPHIKSKLVQWVPLKIGVRCFLRPSKNRLNQKRPNRGTTKWGTCLNFRTKHEKIWQRQDPFTNWDPKNRVMYSKSACNFQVKPLIFQSESNPIFFLLQL